MNNLAQLVAPEDARLFSARVLEADGGEILIQEHAALHRARRAAGCLLAPRKGDLVLAARMGEECYLLNVLERDAQAPARIEVEGDLELSAPSGSLEVSARDGLDMASPARVGLTASELSVTAAHGRVALESLSFLGGLVRARLDKLRLAARTVDSVVERLTQSLKNRFTRVEELDRLEAACISQEADDLFSARGKYSLVSAEEDVKIDGGMIHLG
jgi:hypothetical protein